MPQERVALTVRTLALPAATSTNVASGAGLKTIYGVMNIGTGDATLSSASPAVMDAGWPMDKPSIAGRQGGGIFFESGIDPSSDLNAISTVGTTLAIMEG